MYTFDSSRVNVQFRNGVTATRPVVGRKYTLTHSDETGELFVTIGTKYAEDKVGAMRDEVRLGLVNKDNDLHLFGMVLISGEGIDRGAKKRTEIFLKEMPLALQAIRYADSKLYKRWPRLDKVPIRIWFKSNEEEYNKLYEFGTMSDYAEPKE